MMKYCKQCIYETLPYHTTTFAAQAFIFFEGSPLSYVYRIKEGFVKINRIHPNGDEKTFDILGPGDYVALLAVLQGKDIYIATAIALTKVVAIKIEVDDVLKAYQSNDRFQSICLRCAVTRSTMFQDKLFQTANIDTEDKILSTLQLLARKFGKMNQGRMEIELPFSKTELANIIGIRRETLSRKLSKMQKAHIIQIDKNKYILDRV